MIAGTTGNELKWYRILIDGMFSYLSFCEVELTYIKEIIVVS